MGDALKNTDKLSDLGNLAPFVPALDLEKVKDDILAKSKAVKDFVASQIAGLKKKLQGMNTGDFAEFVEKLNPTELAKAIADFAEDGYLMAKEKAEKLIAKIEESDEFKDVKEWTDEQLKKIKAALNGLKDSEIAALNANAIKNSLDMLRENVKLMSKDQAKKWNEKVKQAIGDLKKLTQTQLEKFPKMIEAVTWKELPSVNIKLLAKLDDKAFIDIDYTVDLKAFPQWIEKFGKAVKEGVDLSKDKLDHLRKQIYEKWGEIGEWSESQIESIKDFVQSLPVDDIKDAAEEFFLNVKFAGELTAEQLRGAAAKLKTFSAAALKRIIEALNSEELRQALDDIRKAAEWTYEQAEAIVAGIVNSEAFGAVSDWTKATLEAIGDFLRGIDVVAIKEVTIEIFKDAVEVFRDIVDWTAPQLSALADKAVEAFGAVKTWTADTVARLGVIVVGLEAGYLKKNWRFVARSP